jgi:hypothetical protein
MVLVFLPVNPAYNLIDKMSQANEAYFICTIMS